MYIDRSQHVASQYGALHFEPLDIKSSTVDNAIFCVDAVLPSGSITIIEIQEQGYTLWWAQFFLSENVTLTFKTPARPSLGIVYPINQDVSFSVERLGSEMLKKQQYMLHYLSPSTCRYDLDKGVYSLFGVQFSMQAVSEKLEHFGFSPTVFEKIRMKDPHLIQGDPSVSVAIDKIIDELYQYPHLEPHRKMFMCSRALDLLRIAIQSVSDLPDKVPTSLSEYEIRKLNEVKDLFTNDPGNQMHLNEISAWAGLNEQKFKSGFKALFGMPPFEFKREQRMLLAEMLIKESGMSMKAIAAKVGYGNLSNFVTAFKEKFGVSPKRFRHRKF